MKYTMKSKALYDSREEKLLARLKGVFTGPEKYIVDADGKVLMRTGIHTSVPPAGQPATVGLREYILTDADGQKCASATPGYARGHEPDIAGWPLCQLPRVDHAQITLYEKSYLLVMKNSQNYCLYDSSGSIILQVFHKGIAGGWEIEDNGNFSAGILCGIFTFCRYIERENDFLVA